MLLTIHPIHENDVWESFVRTQPFTVFVQSQAYAAFYRQMHEDSVVFGVYRDDTLVAGTLALTTHARRGSFLYVPYGPVISPDIEAQIGDVLLLITRELKRFARERGLHFIRISPFIDDTKEHRSFFSELGYRHSPLHVLAEHTWLLGITPDEETLLMQMNKNHRNLIRRCQKDGVRIEMHTSVDALAPLHTLLDETAKRHQFQRYSREYIDKEFMSLPEHERAVFHAYLPDGRLDAAAVIVYYGTMAAYRHSGSLGLNNKLPTSYLLQWHAITEAKRRGMLWYNFWGIAPPQAKSTHPFFGITHFKKGFGGIQKDLLPCQDLPLSAQYYLTWAIETLRRFRRGF